MSIFNLL